MGHESNNNPEQSELPDIGKIEQLKQRLREIENAITEAEGIPSEEVAAAVIDKKQQEIVECNARKVELEMEIQENLESLMGKLANESNALADGRALAPDANFGASEKKISTIEDAIAENRRALQELSNI